MPRSRKQPPQRFPVSVQFEGKTYSGEYWNDSGVIVVHCEYGTERTLAGGAPVADLMLLSILRKARESGLLK